MSDTSRNDEVMKYCFGDDAEFVAVKHYERLQRELADAREQISTLMHQQTIAMQELQEKWHAALKQRDILETALMIIEGYYVDGENTYEDWKAMGQTAKNALSRITLI